MLRSSELVLLILTLTLVQYSECHAKTFTRCQLSRELLRYNFPRSLIPNWVCLIEHASSRTTEKVTNHNNSYSSFGLFQNETIPIQSELNNTASISDRLTRLSFPKFASKSNRTRMVVRSPQLRETDGINNKEWCKKGRKGGHCNMKCEDLLNEDLADDVRCAKRIYERVGFKAWPSSYAHCKQKSLPDISRC